MDRFGEDLNDVDPRTGAKIKDKLPDNDAAIGLNTAPMDDVDEESEILTKGKTPMLQGAGENLLKPSPIKGQFYELKAYLNLPKPFPSYNKSVVN